VNNHISETTGMSPFFANYGLDPRCQVDLTSVGGQPQEVAAKEVVSRVKEITGKLQAELT